MKQLILRSGKYLFFFLLVLLSSLSCKEIDSQIPDVPVSFQINLITLNELTVPGNSVYFPQAGFGGVIIYCEIEGSYYAFDAACTNEINTGCRVENKGLLGTCSCCGSEFVFVGGSVVKGPASAPLKQYNVSVYGDMLRVYN